MKEFLQKGVKQFGPILMLIVLPLAILMPVFVTHQMNYNLDVWFNLMRIQEMNDAVRSGYFPGLGNVHTLGNAGQFVQGMYPSFTLGVLVALTSFLSAINQIYAIYYLILLLVSVSYFVIFKKVSQSSWGALAKAIIMSYPVTFHFMLLGGQFGLTLAYVFLPFVFWGLYKIRDAEYKSGYLYIGLGVGLIFNSHMASALFSVILVMFVAFFDFLFKQRNFIEYVKAGILSGLIGLPTLFKLLLLKGAVVGVAVRETEAKMSILSLFGPLWNKYSPYFGVTSFMMIGLIFVIATVFKETLSKSMKATVIIMVLMGTTSGYLIFFTPIQFPIRFLTYALQLALFIFLMEFPNYYTKLGKKNVNLIYGALIFLACVPAVNASLKVRDVLIEKPLWQVKQEYRRSSTKIDKASFEYEKFVNMRTYMDYLPSQQMKTATKRPLMFVASKQMRDVNEAKSVRLTGFDNDEIRMSKFEKLLSMDDKRSHDNIVVPYQPATNVKADKRTVTMDVKVKAKGNYDLPFWMYPRISYTVLVDGKHVTPTISEQGRMSVPLTQGKHAVSITQDLPISVITTYIISWVSIIGTIYLIKFKRK